MSGVFKVRATRAGWNDREQLRAYVETTFDSETVWADTISLNAAAARQRYAEVAVMWAGGWDPATVVIEYIRVEEIALVEYLCID